MVFLFGLASCGQQSSQEAEKEEKGMMAYFTQFPNRPFLNLSFGETKAESIEKLKSNGFTEKPTFQNRFLANDSTEVILSEADNLYGFKVFFFSTSLLAEQEELCHLFAENAIHFFQSDTFSIYEFGGKNEFKITTFMQEDFIRLNVELKATH